MKLKYVTHATELVKRAISLCLKELAAISTVPHVQQDRTEEQCLQASSTAWK
jgi:hypothetical protein